MPVDISPSSMKFKGSTYMKPKKPMKHKKPSDKPIMKNRLVTMMEKLGNASQ